MKMTVSRTGGPSLVGTLLAICVAAPAAATVASAAEGSAGNNAVDSTELAKAAAAMKPGEWREIKTVGMNRDFQHRNQATGKRMTNSSFTWSNELCWDPVTRNIFYLNNGHGQPKQFFCYSDATNTWTLLPLTTRSRQATPTATTRSPMTACTTTTTFHDPGMAI